MLQAVEAIDAIALKLVLLGRLDPTGLSPLVAQLKASAGSAGETEIGQLDALLQAQPSTAERYAEFSAILERLRWKLTPGAAGGAVGAKSEARGGAIGGGSSAGLLKYDTSNSPEIMNHFFLESTAHLEAVEAAALHLEANPHDQEALTGAFRAFHSLKGVTGFLDLRTARDLIHHAEALIEIARKRPGGMLPKECDQVLRTVDMERVLVGLVREHAANPANPFPALPEHYAALLAELQQATAGSGIRPAVGDLQVATPEVKPALSGKSGVRRGPSASSAAALAAIVQPMEEDSGVRAPAAAPNKPASGSGSRREATHTEAAAATNREPAPLPAPAAPSASKSPAAAAIPSAALEAESGGSGVSEAPRRASNEVEAWTPPAAAAAGKDTQNPTAQFSRRESDQQSAALVRVQVEKLDRLIDAIGELAITQIQIFQNERLAAIEDESLVRNVTLAGKITRELQTLAMTLRMVPLRETFGRMTRMARDIAHRQGKEVTVEIEGEETEMDKSLIELLLDPLTHLVRNAVDHGVALPEEREKMGKPRRATLKLAARSQGGYVMVEVSDDGNGLNLPKILAKARQKGMLREGESPDPLRLQQFIFEPGFSTAEQVTDLSGRGIGLDVVRNQAASAGGRVSVLSEPGRSTSFTITLPLTLAIIDGLVVLSGRQEFILPLTLVVESLRPTKAQLGTVHERGLTVNLRGHAFPLVRLSEYAHVTNAKTDPCDSIVIIVDSRGEQFALQVDEIIGVQQVVIKNLGDRLHGLKGISGGAILGDGRVRLILDVIGILAHSRVSRWSAAG